MDVRALLTDDARGFDEVFGVVVVLGKAGGDGEDIRVKDYILRREVDTHQQLVRPLAYRHFILQGGGLTLLVKRHHDHSGSVLQDLSTFRQEIFFTFLKRDAVDDGLTLRILQPSFDNLPLRRVDHERDGGDFGVAKGHAYELGHSLLAVDEAVVQVEVQDLGTVLHLLFGHADGGFKVVVLDELLKSNAARDIAPFANIDKRDVRGENELGHTGEHREGRVVRENAAG